MNDTHSHSTHSKLGGNRLVWILALAGALAADAGTDTTDPALALVFWMRGDAVVEPAAAAAEKPLRIFDRLGLGSRIRTEPGSEVKVAFFDGQRFALGAQSRAVIESRGLEVERGSSRRLEPVPALVRIPRLAAFEKPGESPGTARIRTAPAEPPAFELRPRDEAVLPNAAVLRFGPVAAEETYRVEVLYESGELAFAVETHSGEVAVPAGVLEPGALHYWQVVAGDREVLLGSALFTALSDQDARTYRELAEQLQRSDDPGSLLLLAAVELRLGLGRRACEGMSTALGREPGNAALWQVVSRFGCAGEGRGDRHDMAIVIR